MFVEAIESILMDRCTTKAIREIEGGATPAPLWSAFAQSGFLELLTPERLGGAGIALEALFPIIECFGRYAVPLPLAQSIVARALLVLYDVPVPDGMFTLAAAHEGAGQNESVFAQYGAIADVVLIEQDGDLLMRQCAHATRTATGVHGSLSATLRWERGSRADCHVAGAGHVLRAYAASIHAALLAGAMNRVLAMSLQYANDRSQFGKPIGKFQAIQQQLAVMAEQVAAANIAAELGFKGENGSPDPMLAVIAKARTSEAVTAVVATAHALHGAIGVTEEYDLQLFTRRMHEWRMAHGSEHYWNTMVGEALLSSGRLVADFVREPNRC
ncbi:acyl-CoA dehydrogenase family protein [Caballeronia sp. AZ7_KS35]|uniref:acyl-CoA dehydrogenase family protein n=1 Tax=Caballeronia sp. AZ7_KS35 TaxID=2921762 RepID=UPI002028138D|nr:acyl-CoA dehydrogenase family protein [Caballeronia sp. AZ7_KS35]